MTPSQTTRGTYSIAGGATATETVELGGFSTVLGAIVEVVANASSEGVELRWTDAVSSTACKLSVPGGGFAVLPGTMTVAQDLVLARTAGLGDTATVSVNVFVYGT
jgi:hypothetical protein